MTSRSDESSVEELLRRMNPQNNSSGKSTSNYSRAGSSRGYGYDDEDDDNDDNAKNARGCQENSLYDEDDEDDGGYGSLDEDAIDREMKQLMDDAILSDEPSEASSRKRAVPQFMRWEDLKAMPASNKKKKASHGASFDDDEEENDDGDGEPDDGDDCMDSMDTADETLAAAAASQGDRASNLRVASPSGKDMGAYAPPISMSLNEAYSSTNPTPLPPKFLKSRGTGSIRKRKRSQLDTSSSDDENSYNSKADDISTSGTEDSEHREAERQTFQLLRELNIDPADDAVKSLLKTQEARYATASASHRHSKRPRGGTSESRKNENGDSETSDTDYIRHHFREMLDNAGMTPEQLRDIFCPLCGFGNLINEESVDSAVFAKIQKIAEVGVMMISIETLAFILVELWNDGIYRRMKAAGKRMLPFTFAMAFEHLSKPHRPDPRPDLRSDIEMLALTAKTAARLIYYRDPLTNRVRYDPKAFLIMKGSLQLKAALRRTNPEKLAFFVPRLDHNMAAASGIVNPLRNVHFVGRNNGSDKKRTAGSLGGRQAKHK